MGGRRGLMDRAATKWMDRGVRGSNPAAAYLDLFFGPNFSGGIAPTTYIELTFREASIGTHIDGWRSSLWRKEDGDDKKLIQQSQARIIYSLSTALLSKTHI